MISAHFFSPLHIKVYLCPSILIKCAHGKKWDVWRSLLFPKKLCVPNDTIIPLKLPKFYSLFHIIFVLYSSHNQAPKQKSTTFSTNSYNLSTAKCNKKLQIIGSVEISPFQFQWDQNSDFPNA